jgi:hypothetical protein
MSRRERATRVVLAGVGAGLVFSLIHDNLGTISMLWEIALCTAFFAVLTSLDSFLQRRRRAKRL